MGASASTTGPGCVAVRRVQAWRWVLKCTVKFLVLRLLTSTGVHDHDSLQELLPQVDQETHQRGGTGEGSCRQDQAPVLVFRCRHGPRFCWPGSRLSRDSK